MSKLQEKSQMKESIGKKAPFYRFASDTLDMWSNLYFPGIETDSDAADCLDAELKVISSQGKILGKKLKSLRTIIINNSFGIEAFLPKVEEEYITMAALLFKSASIIRQMKTRRRV